MDKKQVSNDELVWIFRERLSTIGDLGRRIPIAIVRSKQDWSVVTGLWSSRYAGWEKHIAAIQDELRREYHLVRDRRQAR
jgi:hypothetical protein